MLFALLAAVPATAADAWFGVDSPDARAKRYQRERTAIQAADFAPLSIRLPAAEDPYAAITADEVHKYLAEILAVTREHRPPGERFWGRIAGSRSEIESARYMAERFREFGLKDVRLEPVVGKSQWWPKDWEVTLQGDRAYGKGTRDYTFPSAFPALQLGGEPLNFEQKDMPLVFVGRGHALDLVGRDLRGKVAVVQAAMTPDAFFQTARGHVDGIVEAGASGVLTALDAPGNYQFALEDMGPHDVPAFVLGGDDGRFLIDAMTAAGPDRTLQASIRLQTEIRPTWQGENVLATIPGTSDEWIVIIAHLDGYFEAANDNGGGMASLLALARHFAERPEPPRRSMLFVGTAGHHEYSDGAEALISAHRELLESSVIVMNVEHPSSMQSYYRGDLKFKDFTAPGQLIVTNTMGTRSLNVSNGNPLIIEFYKQAIDRYGLVIDAVMERRPPSGDAYGFFLAGFPVAQIIDSNVWYHSDGDLIDVIDKPGLARGTRVYAEVLDQIDKHDREALTRRR